MLCSWEKMLEKLTHKKIYAENNGYVINIYIVFPTLYLWKEKILIYIHKL